MKLLVVLCALYVSLSPIYGASSFEVSNVKIDEKVVAITFDDGPTEEFSGKILNILDFFDCKGTFFFIGSRVSKYPEITKKAHAMGHEIGNHSFNHEDFSQLKSSQIKKDIGLSQSVFKDVLGSYPSLIRPPYGSYQTSQLKNMKPYFKHLVKWNIDPRDWEASNDKERIKKHILDEVRPGAIILLHENSKTLSMLPFLILELEKRGYRFVTVSELIGMGKN